MKYALFGNVKDVNIPFERDDVAPDIVFSFGGDGTMLGAIHKYKNYLDTVKFVGINTGRLGFFTDFKIDELDKVISMIKKDEYRVNSYNLLEYTLKSKDYELSGYAVNDIAITNPIHTQIIDVYINEKHFETFRGTGLLISPPTGSTAYNKSLGGSIIDPHIKAIQLTEFAPINNRVIRNLSSPLVLSEKSKIALKFEENENIFISVDGKFLAFNHLTEVNAKLSDTTVKFIEKMDTKFFDKVRRAFISKD
ncbi:MAG TPA: NAD kinase [Acholeplasmataceae bacterium]|nr:NAD kinase [Acholeplasmataceae bacterium]